MAPSPVKRSGRFPAPKTRAPLPITCPSCGGGGIYAHCCEQHDRVVKQPCKHCRAIVTTTDPDCRCYENGASALNNRNPGGNRNA